MAKPDGQWMGLVHTRVEGGDLSIVHYVDRRVVPDPGERPGADHALLDAWLLARMAHDAGRMPDGTSEFSLDEMRIGELVRTYCGRETQWLPEGLVRGLRECESCRKVIGR